MQNNNPLISVITPTYNSENFISECIESVLTQNFDSFEHIIVDSFSSDKTIKKIKNYKHVKFIQKKTNIYEAYNEAIKHSLGKYIFILNSDDLLAPDSFKIFNKKYLNNLNYDVYCSHNIEFNIDLNNQFKKRVFTDPKFFSRGFINFKSQSILGCYININLIKKLNYFNTKYFISSDKDFLIKMAIAKIKLYNINHSSYLVRIHNESLTYGKNSKETIIEIIKQNKEILMNYINQKKIPIGVKYFCKLVLFYRRIQEIKLILYSEKYNFIKGLIKIAFSLFDLIVYFLIIKIYKTIILLKVKKHL